LPTQQPDEAHDVDNLFDAAAACIAECDPTVKAQLTAQVAQRWREGQLSLDSLLPAQPFCEPGRPALPRLVSASGLPRRSPATIEGRAALIHAITHIEFNAINLAWDAVYRFRDMPRGYYDDWVCVAAEEAEHFLLLRKRLRDLGHDYGDFTAHDALWDMAGQTAHDVLERMALVPRVLEARGLDVTPKIMEKLRAVGDDATCAALEIILRDEVGHVERGSRWFNYLCGQRGLDPEPTFMALLQRYVGGKVRGPLHLDARRRAGFSESELEQLGRMAS
jgi:uncharacterized ferritin-like protein (DUF455 family)